MQTLEYRTKDKSEWPRGPWESEPDKKQWPDEATGLPCLIVRNNGGALCGYVGVPEKHPLYGKNYSDRVPADRDKVPVGSVPNFIGMFIEASHDEDGLCAIDCLLQAHGGITFADGCFPSTREQWEKWRTSMIDRKGEAEKFPQGDMARAWKEKGHLIDDFEAWQSFAEQSFICHKPADGEPENVWWFGFDCSHSGDRSPAYERHYSRDGVYRDFAYVTKNVEALAKQLAAMAA